MGELEKIQSKLGFRSRSKLLRATINSLLNEYRMLDSLKGHADGVMVVTYKETDKNRISSVVHRFEREVKTVVHQHHNKVCIDIMVICCDADRIRELFSALKREKGVKSLSCSVL